MNGKLNYEFFTELGIRDKEKRCLETLTRAVGRDYSDRLRFISACPIGYFTCYDGFCGANMFECFDRCTEPYCQGFEIRFSDVACDEDCRFGVTGACAEASSESINLPAVPTDPVCCDVAIDELEPYEDLADCCPEISDTTHFLGPVYPEPSGTLPDPDFRVFVPEIRSPELAEALRIEFNFKEGDALCCCPVHCTCTGDPHCTAFNTRRGSVYSDYGAFSFLQEGDLEIRLHLGPRGIVENVTVFLPGEPQKYRLNVEDAFLNRWQMVSDSGVKTYPPTSDLPSVLTSNFYSNDGDYRPGVISTELLVPKTEVTLAFNGLLLVTIQLKRHLRGDWRRLLTIDPNSFELESYERLRFDVKAKRFLKQADDGCCPSGSALSLTYKDQLDEYADGFCWRPLSDTIRNFFEQKGFVKRQLDVSHPRVLQGADEYLLREKCDEYVFLANSYGAIDDLENILTRCIEDQLDFGVGEIQELIDQLKLSANLCISPADIALGPTFQRELQECEYGLIFEARRRDLPASGWSFVRSIPADRSYCGNAITFSNETAIMFDLDGTITALDLQLHEVRFKEKSHLPDACPKCEPSRTLSKLTTEVLYSCGTVTCFPPTVPTTGNPTPSPASIPPSLPTADPTPNPTSNPTSQPTADPTPIPTSQPTSDATLNPTSQATADPTPNPTSQPTAVPTPIPTSNPTSQPTADPTSNPTATVSSAPTMSFAPTDAPTLQPTDSPNCLGPNVAELNFYASKAQINNLGGICGDGAVVNETCGEIFPPVIQFSNIGTYNGRTIDLTISNTSLYVPAHELPGKAEHLGFVSAGIGAGVDLSFQFTDAADNSPLVMDYLVLSLHNLAKSCTCATCAQCELICEDFEGFRMLSPLNKTKLFLDDNSFLCLIREGTAATSITDLIFEKPYVRDLLTDEQIRVSCCSQTKHYPTNIEYLVYRYCPSVSEQQL